MTTPSPKTPGMGDAIRELYFQKVAEIMANDPYSPKPGASFGEVAIWSSFRAFEAIKEVQIDLARLFGRYQGIAEWDTLWIESPTGLTCVELPFHQALRIIRKQYWHLANVIPR